MVRCFRFDNILQYSEEDLGATLCPPDRAGIADVTQRVAAESSFALAKGNVKGNGILGTPVKLMVPASRWSCSRYTMRHTEKEQQRNSSNIQMPDGRGILTPLTTL